LLCSIANAHPLHLLAVKTACDGAGALNRIWLNAAALHHAERRFLEDQAACADFDGLAEFFSTASYTWFLLVRMPTHETRGTRHRER
jgi:hypothetical protein